MISNLIHRTLFLFSIRNFSALCSIDDLYDVIVKREGSR